MSKTLEEKQKQLAETTEQKLEDFYDSFKEIFGVCERSEEILDYLKGARARLISATIRHFIDAGLILPEDTPFMGPILPSLVLKGVPFSITGKDLEETFPANFLVDGDSYWLFGIHLEDTDGRSFEEIKKALKNQRRKPLSTIEIMNFCLLCPDILKQDEKHEVLCVSPRYPGRWRIITIQKKKEQFVFECSHADYGNLQNNVNQGTKLLSSLGWRKA